MTAQRSVPTTLIPSVRMVPGEGPVAAPDELSALSRGSVPDRNPHGMPDPFRLPCLDVAERGNGSICRSDRRCRNLGETGEQTCKPAPRAPGRAADPDGPGMLPAGMAAVSFAFISLGSSVRKGGLRILNRMSTLFVPSSRPSQASATE